VVQKAVEMGVGRLQPVITRRTQAARVNLQRMRANVVEAAEQCGILAVPEVSAEQDLASALAALEPGRLLVFCDEDAEVANPAAALAGETSVYGATPSPGLALLIGPEGGFADEERRLVSATRACVGFRLGRAFCAPTRPRSRRSRSSRRRSGIGAEVRLSDALQRLASHPMTGSTRRGRGRRQGALAPFSTKGRPRPLRFMGACARTPARGGAWRAT
jgi:hypothetical protein